MSAAQPLYATLSLIWATNTTFYQTEATEITGAASTSLICSSNTEIRYTNVDYSAARWVTDTIAISVAPIVSSTQHSNLIAVAFRRSRQKGHQDMWHGSMSFGFHIIWCLAWETDMRFPLWLIHIMSNKRETDRQKKKRGKRRETIESLVPFSRTHDQQRYHSLWWCFLGCITLVLYQ